MTQRKLKTIKRLVRIRRRSLNEKCQELVQNEGKLRDLIRNSNLLRQRQEQILSEQLKTYASLEKQVQSALWSTKLETRFAQHQEMIHDYQEKCVRLRRRVKDSSTKSGRWKNTLEN